VRFIVFLLSYMQYAMRDSADHSDKTDLSVRLTLSVGATIQTEYMGGGERSAAAFSLSLTTDCDQVMTLDGDS